MEIGIQNRSGAARKHRQVGRLPSKVAVVHTRQTWPDAFEEVWEEVRQQLEASPGLQAKTLFEWLKRKYQG